jgi:hypothetical protein
MRDSYTLQPHCDIRYAFPHGCNASAIPLKGGGSTLPRGLSGFEDKQVIKPARWIASNHSLRGRSTAKTFGERANFRLLMDIER